MKKFLLNFGPTRRWLERRFGRETLEAVEVLDVLLNPPRAALPTDLVPQGVRQLARGLLTSLLVPTLPDWIWPHWMVRQFDPTSPSFVPRAHQPAAVNLTHRNWTPIGVPGVRYEAHVDPAGLVVPFPQGPGIDCWLHDGERLWAPSRLPELEQSFEPGLPNGPELVTRWRAGGFELEHCVRPLAPPRPGVDSWAGVWIQVQVRRLPGASDAAGRVVLSLRPANVEAIVPLTRVSWKGGQLYAGDRVVLTPVRAPEGIVLSNRAGGDVAARLDEARPADLPGEVQCPHGLAHAALVFSIGPGQAAAQVDAIAHTQGAMPAGLELREAGASTARLFHERLADAFDVELPPDRPRDRELQAAFRASRVHLLALWDGDQVTPGPDTYHHFWLRDSAYMTSALDRLGLRAEAALVLATYPGRQRRDGFFLSQDGEWDAAGQAIWTLVEHWRLTRDDGWLAGIWPAIRKAAAWIDHTRRSTANGLMPPGFSAEHLGPPEVYYWDALWGAGGLLAAGEAAEALGLREEAAAWRARGFELLGAVEASWATERARLDSAAPPAAAGRQRDSGMVGNLAGWYPLEVQTPDERLAAQLAALDAVSPTGGIYQAHAHCGINSYLTMQRAICAIQLGVKENAAAWKAIEKSLAVAHPTWTWPEATHPATNGGCMGDGSSGWGTAELLHMVRYVCYLERRDELVLWPGAHPSWWEAGKGFAFRNAASRFGRLACSVRVVPGCAGPEAEVDLEATWQRRPERVVLAMPSGEVSVAEGRSKIQV